MDRVSVIVPAYNAEEYLAQAITSVFAQSYRPMETIVVDDGSTDGTRSVAASFGPELTYLEQTRAGAAAARNAGVRAARGEFIAFLDADDLWEPNKLAHQMRSLEEEPALDMVFGHVQQFVSPDLSAAEKANLKCDSAPMPGQMSGAMVIRAASFQKVGEFNTNWAAGEFIEWYGRAREAGLKELMLQEVVCRRRLHRSNHGIVNRDARHDYLKIIKNALDRRRRSSKCG